MNIAVVGLGLIGGSMAKSIKRATHHTVWGVDISEAAMLKARAMWSSWRSTRAIAWNTYAPMRPCSAKGRWWWTARA